MGKDFITLLDLVKYQRPIVVLPDESFRVFQGRCSMLYSTIKNMRIELVPASNLDDLTLADAYKTADALYFLEYSLYPKDIRKFVMASAKDIDFTYSLLKIRAQNLFPVQIVGSYNEDELKTLSELLGMPINRVLKDY